MPKSEKREYRNMPALQIRKGEAEEQGKEYRVRGYATTFDESYQVWEDFSGNPIFEKIDRKAFSETDMSDVILQYDHCGMVYARTRNKSLQLTVDDHGLLVEADLGLTQESRKLYEAIETGLVYRMSFCFTIAEGGDEWDKETRTNTITKIAKLYDVSAVSIPANEGTDISAELRKRMDGAIQGERAERLAEEARQKKIRILQVRLKAMRARG
jgi:HK97 family phage prohead protease